jgi:hypothetical protein
MPKGGQRELTAAINVRLSAEQDNDVRELARLRGVSASEGLRTLIDLGRMLHAGHVAGVSHTPELLKLLRSGDALVSFRAGLTPAMCDAVGLADVDAAKAGGLVLMTGEQGDLCDAIAADSTEDHHR